MNTLRERALAAITDTPHWRSYGQARRRGRLQKKVVVDEDGSAWVVEEQIERSIWWMMQGVSC